MYVDINKFSLYLQKMSITKSKKFIFLGLFTFLAFFMSWWGGYITSYYKEPWYS